MFNVIIDVVVMPSIFMMERSTKIYHTYTEVLIGYVYW